MGFNFVQAPINEPFFVNDRISPIWLDYFNRLIGKEEFKNLEDTVDTLKSTVDLLNEDSESALEVLTTWSSDGVLSPDEKVVMNAGFIERCVEYVTILTQATAFSISTDTLTETFEDWGTYLNNGVSWSAPESTTITDDDIPSWINETGQTSSTTVVQADFVNYATLYFAALTAIKVLIEEFITENLTGVVDIIAGWAVDGKFSPIEKAHMNVGWIARSTEYLEVKAAAEDLTLSTTTFTAAFETWGTYLNNGISWEAPTTTPILDADMPVWIQEANLGTTTDIDREDFIDYASDYLNALIVMKIAIAENVNDNIDAAVNVLDDWASDGTFSYLEKVAFKDGWDIRSVEYLNLYNQAIDLGLTTAANTFKTAFETWGTYLNAGSAWTALESLPVNDDKTPAWIKAANMSTSTTVARTAFVETANTYFTALGVIKDLLAETISDNISGAIDTLDDWAKDTVFAPIEKKAFYDGWKIRSTEFLDIKARADELSIDTEDLVDYFEDWGTYLNDDVAWTAPSVVGDIIDANMPSWFNSSTARSTATTVVRADFVNNAQAYLTELYTVRGLIADQVNTDIGSAADTANWSGVSGSGKPDDNADVTNLTNITTAVQSNTLAFTATSGKISFGGSTHYINGTSSNLNLVGGAYNTLTMNDSTGINLSARYGIDITDTVSGGIDINSSSGTVYLRTTSGNAYVYGASTTLGTGNTVTCNTSGVTITAAGSGDDVNVVANDNFDVDVGGDINLDCGSGGGVYIEIAGSDYWIFGSAGLYPAGGKSGTLNIGSYSSYMVHYVHANGFYDDNSLLSDTLDDLYELSKIQPRKEIIINPDTNEKSKGETHIDPKSGLEIMDNLSLPKHCTNYDQVFTEIKAGMHGICVGMITDEELIEALEDYNDLGWMVQRNVGAYSDLVSGGLRQLDIEMKELVEIQASRITTLETQLASVLKRLDALEGR